MNRRRVVAVAFVGMALGGCGPIVPPATWVKPGVEPAQQRRDEYECERHAVLARTPGMTTETLYGECMRARGYLPRR